MPVFKMIIIGGWGVDDMAYGERWLLREHAGETQSWIGPWLERYVRYWSVMPPAEMVPDLVRLGSYTTGVTMHVYNDYPPVPQSQWGMVGMVPNKRQGQAKTPGDAYAKAGTAAEEQPRTVTTFCYTPFVPTEDFLGSAVNPWDQSLLRWITCFKYPKGVSREEGDDWYVRVHAPEVMRQKGLLRFFSYRTMDWPGEALWHRVTELWYEDFAAWHKAVIEEPPAYTAPAWATYGEYPFLEPNRDLLGSFILERPTHDLLRDNLIYIIGP
jgi:hypothetical protein